MVEDYTIEELDKLIKCKEYLRSKIEIIKEQFIKFYGEDLRDKINECFKNALLVAYKRPATEELLLGRLEYLITRSIVEENLSKDSSWNIDAIINGECSNVSFKYENAMPLKRFTDFYEAINRGEEEKNKKNCLKSQNLF